MLAVVVFGGAAAVMIISFVLAKFRDAARRMTSAPLRQRHGMKALWCEWRPAWCAVHLARQRCSRWSPNNPLRST